MMILRKTWLRIFLLAFVFLGMVVVAPSTVRAANVVVVNLNGAGVGFNDLTQVAQVGGNTGTTVGEQRRIAFQHAADIWGGLLSSSVDIRVGAQFNPLTCAAFSAVLGSAGPTNFFRDFSGAPVAGTYYPVALANALHGTDLDPGVDDISAQFNSNIGTLGCLETSGWYYGLDGNPPAGKIDFVSVLLHELGHGLGFLTLVDLGTGARPGGFGGFNDTFMRNLERHGASPADYPSMTDPQRVAASIDTGNLHWTGANVRAAAGSVLTVGTVGDHVRMFAPNPAQGGSSVSHWDTVATPNQIMEPSYTQPLHNPGLGLELPLFQDIGWTLMPQSPIISVTPGSWNFGSVSVGSVADRNFTVQNTGGGTLAGTASTLAPFSIISGAAYSLVAGASQVTTVRFSPVSSADFVGSVAFTGGAGATKVVTGTGGIPGTLQFSSPTTSVSEAGGTATLTVNRVGGSMGAVSVGYATANGSAIGNATAGLGDYTTKTGTLSWAAGDAASKTISVAIVNDTLVEPDETFTVTLSSQTGGATLGTAVSTVTILDNDNTLQFSAATASVNESAGTVTLNVTRTGTPTGAASVTYSTTGGTAMSGIDFTAASGTLNWGAGDAATKTITVPITNDLLVEGLETFTVNLVTATGATLGAARIATVTIVDNDSTLQFSPATATVNEAAGTVTLNVTRVVGAGSSVGAASVNYSAASGTAIAGSDFTAASATLNWGAGDTALKTITVTITDDTLVEPSETFTVAIASAIGATLGTAKTATVTITDNDGNLSFSAPTYAVSEGVTTVTLTVNRTGSLAAAASVQYATADGTATAGTDYTATSGTLNWAAGVGTARTFTVPITRDHLVDGNQAFTVTLSHPTGSTLGATTVATVNVSEIDSAFQFSAPTAIVSETGGNVILTVNRVGSPALAASVSYATGNGTAIAGSDYTARTGSLAWLANDAAPKTITIPITNDTLIEGNETFSVTLFNPVNAILGSTATTTVTIVDNETAVASGIQFTAAKFVVRENDGNATVTVSRAGDTSNSATVNYATTLGTAIATDFTARSGTLSWAAGDAADKTILIPILNDAIAESVKAFTVTLSNPAGGVLGTQITATVAIADDDDPFPRYGVMPVDFVKAAIDVPADNGWQVSAEQFQAGIYSMRSNTIGDGQKAGVEVTRTFQAGNVSFALKVSSEATFDALVFTIDGVERGRWSGVQTIWTTVTYPLSAGSHTLTWSYEKDGSAANGSDAAWVDTVSLPAIQ